MTQNETLLLGIDIGTTGTKCAIYDLKGELVAHAYQEYSMIHPQPSWAEQDPHRWWNAVQTNLHNCFEQQGKSTAGYNIRQSIVFLKESVKIQIIIAYNKFNLDIRELFLDVWCIFFIQVCAP